MSVTDDRESNLFGLKTEDHTRFGVDKKGVHFGEHGEVAGKKFGCSVDIPNPAHAIKKGLGQLKGAADYVVTPEMGREVMEALSTVTSEAQKLAEGVEQLAEGLAKGASKLAPKDLDKIASNAAKLAGGAAHLAKDAGHVAIEVGKVVGPVIGEVLKAGLKK
ncbi:MAG: hypothetical protein P1U32_07295 [Legionellaceae bacterium]|nr:hypothetical protein [Legionellaceae bacterium]